MFQIKTKILIVFVFAALVGLFLSDAKFAAAAVPSQLNFQGRLTNSSGTAMPDGTYNMKFRIYDAASAGTLLWSEQRAVSASTGITVSKGLFSTQLGDVTSLPPAIFTNQNLYLEVELPTPLTATCATAACESYTEGPMTPRNKMASSAYAFNADTVDGIDGESLAQFSTVNTFTNTNLFKTTNTAALAVQNSSGAGVFVADTTNMLVQVGSPTADANAVVMVLDTKNTAGDPTGAAATNGAMYYNSSSNKFRCYQGSAWVDCITAAATTPTLQSVYNSSSPATITTTAAKGFKLVAGASPTDHLLTVDNTANPVTTANVNGVRVNYAGGTGAIEAAGMRIDYTPGSTSGSTWSGLRVVSNTTGLATGVSSYGIKLEGPTNSGAGTAVGLRVASGFDIGIDVGSGGLQLTNMNDPSAPAANSLKVYAKSMAGRGMVGVVSSAKGPSVLQPTLAGSKISYFNPINGSTATSGIAAGVVTTGTPTARDAVRTNLFTLSRRVGYMTAATAGSVAGMRTAAQFYRGDVAKRGGFFYITRFGLSTANTSTQRTFVGLNTVGGAPTNVDPSSLVTMLGFGCDASDTQFSFMHNDASGTAAKDTLTGSFPCNTADTDLYEARIYSPPNGSTIYYSLSRLGSSDYAEGSTSVDLPDAATILGMQLWTGNNTVATAVGIDVSSQYVETDY